MSGEWIDDIQNPVFVMRISIVLFVLLTTVSCLSDGDTFVPELTTLEIVSSEGRRLDIGASTRFSATGLDQRNQPYVIDEFIAWTANNSNVRVDSDGLVTGLVVGTATITATVGQIEATYEVEVWDSSAPRTEIYVSDAGNFDNPPWQILKYDENGNNPVVFIDSNLGWPQDIVFLEDEQMVIVSNLNNNSIAKYEIATGNFLGVFASGIGGPTRMQIGPDNLLYVLQWRGSGLVLRYDLNGDFVDAFTHVGVPQSIGIAWDAQDNLYVSSFNNGSNGFVRKFDQQGNDLGLFIDSNLRGPTNIWFNGGDFFVSDWSAGDIKQFDTDGNYTGVYISGLVQPEGIAFMLDGSLLLGDGGSGAIKRYNAQGLLTGDLVRSGEGGLIQPNGITVREVNR